MKKIFNRYFLSPIFIHRTHTIYGGAPNLTIRWDKSKMAGTMRTTSYTLEVATRHNKYQWSFVWRPDVTKHYWMKRRKEEAKGLRIDHGGRANHPTPRNTERRKEG